MTRKVATLFGGSGFLGRYLVRRLAQQGYTLRIAVRDPEAARFLMTAGAVGQIVPVAASITTPAQVASAVEGAEIVVNLVGILAERRRGDFDRLQHQGAATVAAAAATAGARAMVHVSAIGADPASKSRYGASKGRGEEAVRAAFPDATILRPSIVFGTEDGFFNLFARMALTSPVMPVICGGTRFQPVFVGDVADAAAAALATQAAAGQVYELGGPEVATFRDLLRFILDTINRKRPLLDIPGPVAALQAMVMERLPGKPFTTDQLLMLARDNVVADGALGLAALGLTPASFRSIVPTYLAQYRRH